MLFKLFGDILREKTVPKFSCRRSIRSPAYSHEGWKIIEENYASTVFEPDNSYFQIKLAEMFLHESTVYGRGFVPLCVLLSDFMFAAAGKETKRQTFPFYARTVGHGMC